MPFCKECGYEINSDDQFCYRCGTPVGQVAKKGKAKAPAKPKPVIPTETTKAQEIQPEAPKKAAKFKIGWLIMLVAAVVVVAIGIAVWWFISSAAVKPLFEDNFSSSDSGWEVYSGNWGNTDYSNGEFAMKRMTAGESYTTNKELGQQTDFAVEVDVKKIPEGMDYNYCGIYFRFQDSDNHYGFYIDSYGEYDIGKVVNGQFTVLKDWTKSDYLKTGTATNKLIVACKGNTIEVYANGHKLATVHEDSFASGELGLCLGTWDNSPTTEYHFDNFKVYEAGAVKRITETTETTETTPVASEVPPAEEVAPEYTSSISAGDWLTYTNEAFGFSVEYPSTWSLNTFMDFLGTVLITEPGKKAIISTSVLPVGSVTLDDLVSGITDYEKQNYLYYELISNNPTTHQGINARVVDCIYQENGEKPRYRSRELFTIVNGNKYSIELQVTPPSDFEAYSQIAEKVIASFSIP